MRDGASVSEWTKPPTDASSILSSQQQAAAGGAAAAGEHESNLPPPVSLPAGDQPSTTRVPTAFRVAPVRQQRPPGLEPGGGLSERVPLSGAWPASADAAPLNRGAPSSGGGYALTAETSDAPRADNSTGVVRPSAGAPYTRATGAGFQDRRSATPQPPSAIGRSPHGGSAGRQAIEGTVRQVVAALHAQPAGRPALHIVFPYLADFDDGWAAAALAKRLAAQGLGYRAWEVFNFLRSLTPDSPHAHLLRMLDVYLCTTMISLCASTQEVQLAFEISREMEQRGIGLNVHTYSALMNVAVKAGHSQVALDTYQRMRQAGCMPNLVTYNTLMDVYGKLGQWAEALRLLSEMQDQGLQPVIRTYNTLMIACNSSNHWQEALQVYRQLLSAGLVPNTTTYNALISAYSKAGDLDAVMGVFRDMVAAGCERSVITYSTLIAACERVGRWEDAVRLYERMPLDGCTPNTVTYNSVITALAQGGQWERAARLFAEMPARGCRPDVVTHTALINAYGRGGQWRQALQVYSGAQSAGLVPDHVMFEALLEALWGTGQRLPQLHAVQLYRTGLSQGLVRMSDFRHTGVWEAGFNSTNTMLLYMGLLMHLAELRARVLASGPGSLGASMVLRLGMRGRSREHAGHSVNATLLTAVRNWVTVHRCPLQLVPDANVRLVASGGPLSTWLASAAQAALGPTLGPAQFSPQDNAQEDGQQQRIEAWCQDAWFIIRQYEATTLGLGIAPGLWYVHQRPAILHALLQVGDRLGMPLEAVHDAGQLLDQAVGRGGVHLNQLVPAAFAALALVAKQLPAAPLLPGTAAAPGSAWADDNIAAAARVRPVQLHRMQTVLCTQLAGNTAAISAVHSLRLYHYSLGYSPGLIPPTSRILALLMSPTPSFAAQPQPQPPTQAEAVGADALAASLGALSISSGQAGPHSGLTAQAVDGPGGPAAAASGTGWSEGVAPAHRAVRQDGHAPAAHGGGGAGSGSGHAQSLTQPSGTQPGAPAGADDPGGSGFGLPPSAAPSIPSEAPDLELTSYYMLHQATRLGEALHIRPSVLAAGALYAARLAHGVLPPWPLGLAVLTGIHTTQPDMAAAIQSMARCRPPPP